MASLSGFGWTPGVSDGQGGLACCDSQGCKESDTLNDLTEVRAIFICLFVLLFFNLTMLEPRLALETSIVLKVQKLAI